MHYVTKYALTGGIEKRDDLREGDDGYVHGKPGFEVFKLGRDCFRSRDEAVAAAEKVRLKKIASLEKQIAKLRNMTFA